MNNGYNVETTIGDLIRQYPTWPSTFSTCECKRSMARGGGSCAQCLEEKLSGYIGPSLAAAIHQAIIQFSQLKREALDKAYGNQ